VPYVIVEFFSFRQRQRHALYIATVTMDTALFALLSGVRKKLFQNLRKPDFTVTQYTSTERSTMQKHTQT